MTHDENILRAVRFERPAYIPVSFHLSAACWDAYDQAALQDLMAAHPLLFPGFTPQTGKVIPHYQPYARKDPPYTDQWGCVWESPMDGITGTVTQHPLEEWSAFADYHPPDPATTNGRLPMDWDAVRERFASTPGPDHIRRGALPHGHTFLLLTYIRGYENVIFDMADEEPRLWELIEMVESFNAGLVRRYLECGANWMAYPEDLGMQVGPMLSPIHFRKYIKPSYERLIKPAREAGCIIHMHSDGDIRDLVDDLIEGGVEAVNLQDLVHGIDWIRSRLCGRVCVDLDVDRQSITAFGTPARIDALIREEVETLGSRQGGLMLKFGLYPGTPLENAAAVMDAMEKYAGYFD